MDPVNDSERILFNGDPAAIGGLHRGRRISVSIAVDWYLDRIAKQSTLNAVREVSASALGGRRLPSL